MYRTWQNGTDAVWMSLLLLQKHSTKLDYSGRRTVKMDGSSLNGREGLSLL